MYVKLRDYVFQVITKFFLYISECCNSVQLVNVFSCHISWHFASLVGHMSGFCMELSCFGD